MRPARALLSFTIVVLLAATATLAGASYYPPAIARFGHYATYPSQTNQFSDTIFADKPRPRGVAADPDGTFWVADPNRDRVVKVTAAGTVIRYIGGTGTANGRMSEPRGVFVKNDGTIFVADTGNDRIQVFDMQGRFLRKFGTRGAGNGQFSNPVDLEWGAGLGEGYVYVVDQGNYRVQQVDAETGSYINKVGTNGTGDGQFQDPVGIAVAADRILVSDYDLDRVQIFDVGLMFVDKFGVEGSENYELYCPTGLDATGSSISTITVWVVDSSNYCVKRFIHSPILGGWQFQDKFGMQATGTDSSWNPGRMYRPQDIALPMYSNTTLMVIDPLGLRPYSYIAPSTPTSLTTQSLPNATAKMYQPEAVATTGSAVWTSSDKTGGDDQPRLLKYTKSSTGALTPALAPIETWGPVNTPFYDITDLDCDRAGNVYVLDGGGSRIVKLTAAGTYVTSWPVDSNPGGIDVVDTASTQRVYVCDPANHRVRYFTLGGVYLNQFGNISTTNQPIDIAANDDHIYTIEQLDGCTEVRRFSSTFQLELTSYTNPDDPEWVGMGSEVALDRLGAVYVLDSYTAKMHKFNANLEWMAASGQMGSGTGQSAHPRGLAVDSAGTVFVADTNNNRIQQFKPLTRTTTKVTASTLSPSYNGSTLLCLWLLDADGRAVENETMYYYRSYDGKSWTKVGSAPSGIEPSVYFSNVTRKTWVRCTKVNDGNDFYAAPSSLSSAIIKPKVKLSNPVAPYSAKRGVSFTTYGYLEPKHPAGASSVRIYKYKKSGANWIYAGYTSTKNYTSGAKTKYMASLRISTAGTYKLVAYAPSDSGHASTYSPGYDTIIIK